jgi:hypothetical protein
VGGAAAVLSPRRAIALAVLLAGLVGYGAGAGVLWDASEPWDVAFFALVLVPATLSVVWLVLPAAPASALRTTLAALALVVLAALLHLAGLDSLFNVTKVLALAALGFAFLSFFQPPLGLLVLIASIIPWVDAYSVWRGPTNVVVNEHPGLFERISVAFREPGENYAARLGPPDVLFFAVFLAAAQLFNLRTGWTFLCMLACLGVTLVFAASFDVSGLPALPAVSLGFLLPNADLLWRRWRAWRLSQARAS